MDEAGTDELIEHLLLLSRLKLSDDERAEFTRKFERLLEFVEAVNESEAVADVGRASGAGSLSYMDSMPLGDDEPRRFEWPDGFHHEYIVPIIVGGETAQENEDGESGGGEI